MTRAFFLDGGCSWEDMEVFLMDWGLVDWFGAFGVPSGDTL